jgi:hypothetical protein
MTLLAIPYACALGVTLWVAIKGFLRNRTKG